MIHPVLAARDIDFGDQWHNGENHDVFHGRSTS